MKFETDARTLNLLENMAESENLQLQELLESFAYGEWCRKPKTLIKPKPLMLSYILSLGGELVPGDICYDPDAPELDDCEFISVLGDESEFPGYLNFSDGYFDESCRECLAVRSLVMRENLGHQPKSLDGFISVTNFPIIVDCYFNHKDFGEYNRTMDEIDWSQQTVYKSWRYDINKLIEMQGEQS